ncbi:MAG: gliding motility lipoprotein GldH [Cytophagales bacterium]|nr:gliding motility lipoprotein GldH [Cytophagales bacterium]MDW8383288.1 gliding motility lipoprotein GldH [Flammeovirgaceae bacterium]
MAKKLHYCIGVLLMMISCRSDIIFESYYNTLENQWIYDSIYTFHFSVKQNAKYDIFYNIRNTVEYPFANLYVQYKFLYNDVVLDSGLHEHFLMDQKTGFPLGRSVGSFYDHLIPLFVSRYLLEGNYTIQLRQYMREDTLQGITAVGATIRLAERP